MKHRNPVVLLCALAACNPTDTGNPVVDNGEEGEGTVGGEFGGRCDEDRLDLEEPLDREVAELGFSAADVTSFVLGEHRAPLAWLDANVGYSPESGTSEIVLDVESLGPPRLVRREPEAPRSGEGLLIEIDEVGSSCPDLLELPVRIHVTTAGGALDETVDTVVQAAQAEVARARVTFEVSELSGQFETDLAPPAGFVLTRGPTLGIGLRFAESGASGELGLYTEFTSEDGGAVGMGGTSNVAEFPAGSYCGLDAVSVAAGQVVRGLSIADALSRLNQSFPFQLAGSDATISASFASDVQTTCLELDPFYRGDATTLRFEGTVDLQSSDGVVDGRFDVELSASSIDGGDAGYVVERVVAEASGGSDDPAEAASLASAFGIQEPIDFGGYDGGRYEFWSDVVGSGASTGWLRAYGLDEADCVSNPPEPSADGMSSPGCRGTDRIEIWSVDWARQ